MITHLRPLIINDLNFATFFYDGKTDFQLSFTFLVPAATVAFCLLAYDLILFGTLSPPSPALSSCNTPCVLLSVWLL
jgi:hypothetical protein